MNRLVGLGCALAIAGCSSKPSDIDGTLSATVHNPGSADHVLTPWDASDMPLDTPPGAGNDFFGTCDYDANEWDADLSQSNSTAGVSEIVVSEQNNEGSASVQITAVGTVFTGTCSLAPNNHDNSHDLSLALDCSGLTAIGDPRTLDATTALKVTNCGG